MKNLGNLLKQAQDMQTKMAEVEAGLDRLEIEGTSGGGMVRVTLSGRGVMRRVALDRTLIKPEEIEVLEDLIVAAHNDAKMKLEARVKEEMAKDRGRARASAGLQAALLARPRSGVPWLRGALAGRTARTGPAGEKSVRSDPCTSPG